MAEKEEAKNVRKISEEKIKLEEKKPAKKKEKKPKATAEKKKEEKPLAQLTPSEYHRTLKFVLMTEKSVRQIEAQNKLVFIVPRGATRSEIKAAAESAFQSRVASVKMLVDQEGRKKAFVKFSQPGIAGEIAIRLGII